MFRRSSEPLALSEASLLALRPALNAPVLNADFLPIGPARAAVVVFAEEYGGIGLAIGVRSNDGGQIAVFRNQEPLDASTKIVDALEPALATAERMGFLFDEDMVEGKSGGQGRVEAMALWGQLMGEIESPAPPRDEAILETSTPPEENEASLSDELDELLLDDVAPLDEISLELEDEFQPIEPLAPQLSKFRNAPKPDGNSVEGGDSVVAEGSELGRIPLVRVRREGSRRVPFLARLLSSF